LSAVALAAVSASDTPVPVVVVIHNHAGVAPPVLGRAIQATADALRPLGVGIAWLRPPADIPDGTVVHLRILQRTAQGSSVDSMVGINARADPGAHKRTLPTSCTAASATTPKPAMFSRT
jgi:hypothetical protein